MFFPGKPITPADEHRYSAVVTRKLALLRAHGLIKKVPGTHRYHLTSRGRTIVTALLTARQANAESLMKIAA
ncbi:MAG: hypothetical protein HQL74_13935 [Magnetococcales bacterium]|nr:hypothetical protein [Magnetococcales bacterium]